MPIASRFRHQHLSAKWDRKLLINEFLKTIEIENGSAMNVFCSLSIDNWKVWYVVLVSQNIFSSVWCILSCKTQKDLSNVKGIILIWKMYSLNILYLRILIYYRIIDKNKHKNCVILLFCKNLSMSPHCVSIEWPRLYRKLQFSSTFHNFLISDIWFKIF